MPAIVMPKAREGSSSSQFWAAMSHPVHGKSKCGWYSDWFAVLILAACGGLCQGPLHSWFQRDMQEVPLYLNAYWLSQPMLEEEISSAQIVILCCVPAWIGLAIFTLVPSLSTKRTWPERLAEFHIAMLGHIFALGMELFFQGPLSIYVGEWRPYLLSQCNPQNAPALRQACLDKGYEYCAESFNTATCSNTEGEFFENGWMGRSFVSGHSGFSTASCMYFVYFFLAKTRALHSGRERAIWKILVVLTLMCGTLMVGLSRLVDKRHHWWNILHGFILGFLVGTFAFFYFWPSLYSKVSHSPIAMLEKEGDLDANSETGQTLLYMMNNGAVPDGRGVAVPAVLADKDVRVSVEVASK